MPGMIVVGLQWGDEGKGKVVDLLSEQASHVVRSQGGSNAGHTIKDGEKEFSLHLIPSGILHAHAQCHLTGGVFIDPIGLAKEIVELIDSGVGLEGRLHISLRAQLVLPYHRDLDELREKERGSRAIGTTKRGIGPAACDLAAREGLRVADLLDLDRLKEKLDRKSAGRLLNELLPCIDVLLPYVTDVEPVINRALVQDQSVLFEGAHGVLLDPIYGSYPYVTSSQSTPSGVCAGAGVGPTRIDEVVGVLKAYTTRVGEGPLPTTVAPDDLTFFQSSKDLREEGTTTGRDRRIGWLDLVLASYACTLSGVDNLVLTKLDVLDHLPEIQVCTGYEFDGEEIDRPPPCAEDLARVEPIYETFPGWMCSTREAKTIRQLPGEARALIELIEDQCCVPISMVSVGPSREETIRIDEEWMI